MELCIPRPTICKIQPAQKNFLTQRLLTFDEQLSRRNTLIIFFFNSLQIFKISTYKKYQRRQTWETCRSCSRSSSSNPLFWKYLIYVLFCGGTPSRSSIRFKSLVSRRLSCSIISVNVGSTAFFKYCHKAKNSCPNVNFFVDFTKKQSLFVRRPAAILVAVNFGIYEEGSLIRKTNVGNIIWMEILQVRPDDVLS